MGRIKKGVTSVSPILYEPACLWLRDRYWQRDEERNAVARAVLDLLAYFHPADVGLTCFVTAVMVVLAGGHGWGRRRGWGEFIFWLVFVAAFNLAGLMAYISLKHTVVIRCSGCGKRRGLERVDCPACGLELPEPARSRSDRGELVFGF